MQQSDKQKCFQVKSCKYVHHKKQSETDIYLALNLAKVQIEKN